MKKIYTEPKMLIEKADMCKVVMLDTSSTPADPTQPVLGKNRDEFPTEEDLEILSLQSEQEEVSGGNLW